MKLIFDLDGTLSDPGTGIVNAYNYAFEQHELEKPGDAALRQKIGPPLDISFADMIPGLQHENMLSLVKKFREYYAETGYAENIMYEGIPQMLGDLAQKNFTLGVCTSKREDFAERILKMFGIRDYFSFISGGDVGIPKSDQLRDLVNQKIVSSEDVMIGDRDIDVFAGKQNGINTIAVLWGYGSYVELNKAEPDVILGSVAELAPLMSANV